MMVIIIFALLLLLALVAILVRRCLHRRRDRVKGGFNDGITTRQISATPAGSFAYPQYPAGRTTPSSLVPEAHSQSRLAQLNGSSRVLEKGGSGLGHGVEMVESGHGGSQGRPMTPNAALGRGKLRADAEENEIQPA